MLNYIKSNKIELIDIVRKKYPRCKVLVSNLDLSDMSNVKGCVFAISSSSDTYDLLCEEKQKLQNQGIMSMIVGSYGESGVSVLYKI